MVTPSLSEAVRAAELRRAAAVMARDVDALAACLHDDLVYVHATGVRHDKPALLDFIAAGPEFLEVALRCDAVAGFADAALLHGELRLQLRRTGDAQIVSAVSWASALWLLDGTRRWRLRLFQSTRVAP